MMLSWTKISGVTCCAEQKMKFAGPAGHTDGTHPRPGRSDSGNWAWSEAQRPSWACLTPNASTSDGGVSVAAAVGVNIAKTSSQARIGDGADISSGGAFTLTTAAATHADASADGTAVTPASGSSVRGGARLSTSPTSGAAAMRGGHYPPATSPGRSSE